ncbi:type II toxin-antitoxin system VapC family toxin [Candidatus Berkelbacteria bacterium]|nr:type II toxin-antitoxin system VapC family toxin [Candidatus Berkelbacteria bacterium]
MLTVNLAENFTNFSKLVIDASVAIKWFSSEIDQDKAVLVLERVYQNKLTLAAPNLLIYEIGNALWKGKKLDEKRILAALDSLYFPSFNLAPLDIGSIKLAISFMTRYDITFYDAAYAGLAYEMGCPLLTANPKHFQKISEIVVIELKEI